jgi:hypothetical protein
MRNVPHIKTACGEVGRNQDLKCAAPEAFEGRLTLGLRQVALQRCGTVSRLGQMVRHTLRLMLCTRKHQARRGLGMAEKRCEECGFAVRCDGVQGVRDRRQRDRVVDLYGNRRAQDILGQVPDRLGHGSREQQGLSLRRQVPHNPPDIGEKTHIAEAVCLVEYQHFEMGQIDCSLTNVVEKTTRASNSNVGPSAQFLHLRLHTHTTVEGDLAQGRVLSQGPGDRMNLLSKFARRCED